MEAWIIVPKGEGDIVERVNPPRGRAACIEVTLFLEERVARKAFGRMPPGAQAGAEVVRVEVDIR